MSKMLQIKRTVLVTPAPVNIPLHRLLNMSDTVSEKARFNKQICADRVFTDMIRIFFKERYYAVILQKKTKKKLEKCREIRNFKV